MVSGDVKCVSTLVQIDSNHATVQKFLFGALVPMYETFPDLGKSYPVIVFLCCLQQKGPSTLALNCRLNDPFALFKQLSAIESFRLQFWRHCVCVCLQTQWNSQISFDDCKGG